MTGVIPFLWVVVFCALLHIVIIRTQLMSPAFSQGRKVSRHWNWCIRPDEQTSCKSKPEKIFSPINLVRTYPFAIQIRGRRTRRATLLGRKELSVGDSTYEGPEKKSHDRPAKPGDQQWARSPSSSTQWCGAVCGNQTYRGQRLGRQDARGGLLSVPSSIPYLIRLHTFLSPHELYYSTILLNQIHWKRAIKTVQGCKRVFFLPFKIIDTLVWRCW